MSAVTQGVREREVTPGAGPWRRFNVGAVGLALAAATLVPWLLVHTGQRFVVTLLVTVLVYSMVAQCWNLVLGVSGIFSLGQLVMYAVGGYASSLIAIHLGLSPFLAIWVGGLAAAAIALVIGLAILRLRGVYVALLTLGFVMLLQNYLGTGPEVFGGFYGLKSPGFGFTSNPLLMTYYLGLALFVLTTYAVWRIMYSPVGTAFTALRDSEVYAVSRGIDPFRFRLLLFAYSAFFTGVAGAFMAHYQQSTTPASLSFTLLTNLIMMIVLGGWGTFWGPIVGAVLLVFLDGFVLKDISAGWHALVLGTLLAVVVIVAPEGIAPPLGRFLKRTADRFLPDDDQDDDVDEEVAR
ncbi:MAG: branched-chain amino acid transporter permease [Mycobacterium sp.]|nr:branched-chain amino acid transporter permease [Mycobacterium sp.]